MTYALGAALQTALYETLSADAVLSDLVAGAIFDAVPESAPDLFVALGPERAVGRSDVSGQGAVHEFRISVVTRRGGYHAAKTAGARISDLLSTGGLDLSRGRVVSLRFLRADAKRDEGEGTRRIDLRFRARLDDQDL